MYKSKYLVVFLVFVLIIGVVIFWFWQKPSEFNGTLMEVKDQSIVVQGAYATDEGGKKELITLEIKIDGSTKIVRNTFILPLDGSVVKMDELPKKESQVDFKTFKNDSDRASIGLFIKLKRNIFGYVRPVAKEIRYLTPEF